MLNFSITIGKSRAKLSAQELIAVKKIALSGDKVHNGFQQGNEFGFTAVDKVNLPGIQSAPGSDFQVVAGNGDFVDVCEVEGAVLAENVFHMRCFFGVTL